MTWTKVDQGQELLGGSVWSLVGPQATDTQEVTDCVSGTCAGLLDQDPTPGGFLIAGLDWGTYTLTETSAPAGYTKSDAPVTFVISPDTTGISQDLQLSLPPVENIQILGSVIWEKQNAVGDLLAGSEWMLSGPGSQELSITDCTAGPCPGPDIDPAAGRINIEDLAWGNYSLVETKAPVGYQLDATPIEFAVGPDNADETVLLDWDLEVIRNTQQTAPSLPLTGGLGTQIFLLIGGSALAIALGMTAWRRKKGAPLAL